MSHFICLFFILSFIILIDDPGPPGPWIDFGRDLGVLQNSKHIASPHSVADGNLQYLSELL